MHPRTSCRANGRTRNAVSSMSIWVCTRPNYFYCPSPDFTTSTVSQSVTNNRCAPSCGGTREKWGVFGIVPPPHLQIASDATGRLQSSNDPNHQRGVAMSITVTRCRPSNLRRQTLRRRDVNQSINQSIIYSFIKSSIKWQCTIGERDMQGSVRALKAAPKLHCYNSSRNINSDTQKYTYIMHI